MARTHLLVVGLLSISSVALAGPKGSHGDSDSNGPQPATGGAASKKWDATYKLRGQGGSGALICTSAEDVVAVKGGKVTLRLRAYNPATLNTKHFGCDDPASNGDGCGDLRAFYAKLKQIGAPTSDVINLAELVITIDKDGNAWGSVKARPLPLPDDADGEQKRSAERLARVAVTAGSFHSDNVGRNAGGFGKGRAGTLEISTLLDHGNSTCSLDLRAGDYKVAPHCAANDDECSRSSDCCSHTCYDLTKTCR
jgi:hypothetical protein